MQEIAGMFVLLCRPDLPDVHIFCCIMSYRIGSMVDEMGTVQVRCGAGPSVQGMPQ